MNWIFEVYKIIDSFIMFNVSYLIESTNYVINEIYEIMNIDNDKINLYY